MQKEIVLDHKSSPIGIENWAVCHRMLIHDLIDMAPKIPALNALLNYYRIEYHPSGGYTMSLPRVGSVTEGRFFDKPEPKKAKKR